MTSACTSTSGPTLPWASSSTVSHQDFVVTSPSRTWISPAEQRRACARRYRNAKYWY